MVLEGLAFHQFHGDERLAFVLINVINGADVGVIESRGRAGFALETLQRLTVFGHLFGQKLESHTTAQLGVFGLIHHSHAAATQLFKNAIVRNGLTDHGMEVRSIWDYTGNRSKKK